MQLESYLAALADLEKVLAMEQRRSTGREAGGIAIARLRIQQLAESAQRRVNPTDLPPLKPKG